MLTRVEGGGFFTYLFKEGVVFIELFTHYRGGDALPENHPTPPSDPLNREKLANGPLDTFWPISFYGGGLAIGPQKRKCS